MRSTQLRSVSQSSARAASSDSQGQLRDDVDDPARERVRTQHRVLGRLHLGHPVDPGPAIADARACLRERAQVAPLLLQGHHGIELREPQQLVKP